MEKAIANLGYNSISEFFVKFALPVLTVSSVLFFSFLLFLPLPVYVPYFFLFAGFSFVLGYPYMMFERKKVNIHENIHLFITYAGTISTLHISRFMLFKKIAENKKYGAISEAAEKILYLAK